MRASSTSLLLPFACAISCAAGAGPAAASRPSLTSLTSLTSSASLPRLLARSAQPAERVQTARPDNPARAAFTGISCISSADCVGVAYDGAGTRIERWTGGYWRDAAAPLDGRLTGVSCFAPDSCLAVGYQALLPRFAAWKGRVWAPGTAAVPTRATSALLSGIACVSASECVAVGQWTADGGATISALAERWNGASWSVQSVALPAGRPTFAALDAVSCSSTTSCIAVGNYHGPNDQLRALTESWDGSSWHLLATPNPTAGDDVLDGVACSAPAPAPAPAPAACIAVGDYSRGEGGALSLVERWDGSAWSIVPAADPRSALFDQLSSVSCDAAGDCTAVGLSENDQQVTSPLVERSTGGGRWAVIGAESSAWSGGNLAAVACRPGGWCIAGGGAGNVLISGFLATPSSGLETALTSPIVGLAATPDGRGYYLASADGAVRTFGDAVLRGGLAGWHLAAPIVAIAVDPATGGYWLVAADGGVFAFGAPFYGSTARSHISGRIVGIEPASSGAGYRLVSSDGGVFAFGRAPYWGSMGGRHLNAPIVGIADDDHSSGYWLVAGDGGVFAFHAPFFGSGASWRLGRPIIEVSGTAEGNGYRFAAEDGGVFGFGRASYAGSLGGRHITSPVAGMAAEPSGRGYWLAQQDGVVTAFGGAVAYGSA